MDDLPSNKKAEEKIQQLVAQSQNGDGAAFGEIYDNFIQQIYRYVSFRAPDDEAEDLVELVFLRAWENIHDYKRGVSPFSSWIFRIAHNIVVDYYRVSQLRREAQTSLDDNIPETRREYNAFDRVHRRIEKEGLQKAMSKIPDDYRSILVFKYVNDLSYEEISKVMDRGYAALRILQFRALRALKKELMAMGYDDSELD